ncbi:MAG: hypothetical protein MR210_02350 [Erysipelotrichaceae bacterium]|nr:hypothetical protein [Erysipelotrichaceae bacterium]MDY5251202.1 hypothetical protein [Erysipelotrichaceae bacterium]
MKKLWKKFDELSEKCYMNMLGANKEFAVWDETFDLLLKIINTGRETNPNYAKELVELDDYTDFVHGVGEWLEDYLDDLEIKHQDDKLQTVCKKLLDLFRWEEYKPSDIRFRIASSLAAQGKRQETLEFCEKWYENEEDDLTAATALIYARVGMMDLKGAEDLVRKYISDDTICTEENYTIFIAASTLYKANGNKKKEKQIRQAIKKHEEEIDSLYLELEDEEIDFDLFG